MMKLRDLSMILAAGLLSLPAAFADDSRERPVPQDDLDVTMRIIEDPEALRPDAITRRIELPRPAPRELDLPGPPEGKGTDEGLPPAAEYGQEISREARERGREFGEDAAERARQLAEQARELREDFGARPAERPRPEPPRRDPPTPPSE